jgi:hypothetical protein
MAINFKTVAAAIAAFGVVLGVTFGAGVAYGRGDPKTVDSGLSQQQIQAMLGISGAQAAGGTGGQGTQGGQGQRQSGGTGGSMTSVLGANATAGRVTAVSGQTVTIQTAQGTQRINLAASTSVSKMQTGAIADVREGQTIFITGTRKEDGSFDAAALTQLPPELQALFGGSAPGGSATPAAGGPR